MTGLECSFLSPVHFSPTDTGNPVYRTSAANSRLQFIACRSVSCLTFNGNDQQALKTTLNWLILRYTLFSILNRNIQYQVEVSKFQEGSHVNTLKISPFIRDSFLPSPFTSNNTPQKTNFESRLLKRTFPSVCSGWYFPLSSVPHHHQHLHSLRQTPLMSTRWSLQPSLFGIISGSSNYA